MLGAADFGLRGHRKGATPSELLADGANDGRLGMTVDQRGHVIGEINPLDPFHVRNPAPGCFVRVKGMWRPEDGIPTDSAGQHLAGLLIQGFANR
jgi:hypothetical protein